MANEEKAVLQVEHLDIKFNLRGKVLHAIRDVSLELYEGETLAIVGESGSGKSVLTKAFMGLNDSNGWIDGGSLLYQGHLTSFRGACGSASSSPSPWPATRVS